MKTFKEKLKEKLTSRKFLVTLVGVGCGIACLFGADGETVKLVGGALLTLIPTVVYIIIEGKIDQSGAKRLVDALADTLSAVGAALDEKEKKSAEQLDEKEQNDTERLGEKAQNDTERLDEKEQNGTEQLDEKAQNNTERFDEKEQNNTEQLREKAQNDIERLDGENGSTPKVTQTNTEKPI